MSASVFACACMAHEHVRTYVKVGGRGERRLQEAAGYEED